jgi:hypothetical protein
VFVIQSLVSSAVIGMVIGLCLAFPILVVATSNIIVGLMATMTIVIITVSVVGVIPMAGWKLGVSIDAPRGLLHLDFGAPLPKYILDHVSSYLTF